MIEVGIVGPTDVNDCNALFSTPIFNHCALFLSPAFAEFLKFGFKLGQIGLHLVDLP
jgi:hypothetical protein